MVYKFKFSDEWIILNCHSIYRICSGAPQSVLVKSPMQDKPSYIYVAAT